MVDATKGEIAKKNTPESCAGERRAAGDRHGLEVPLGLHGWVVDLASEVGGAGGCTDGPDLAASEPPQQPRHLRHDRLAPL